MQEGLIAYAEITDRYEKRHKNLAAHSSPAFRVELGDVVTVGKLDRAGATRDVTDGAGRTMPTAIEDCALQRVEGGQEQGCDQDVWQVLEELGCTAIGILCFACDS